MNSSKDTVCNKCKLPVMPWIKVLITLFGTLVTSVAGGSTGVYISSHVFQIQNAIGTSLLFGLVAGGIIGYKYIRSKMMMPCGGEYCNCSPKYEWGEY